MNNNKIISYEGLFFENDSLTLIHSLDTEKLEKANDEIHCTFRYHQNNDEIFNEIVGQTFDIYLIAYGNDGMNSGFLVSLPDELKPYYINYEDDRKTLRTPHITASLSKKSIQSNTKDLDFKLFSEPIKIKGRFGFCIKDNRGKYISFDKFDIK